MPTQWRTDCESKFSIFNARLQSVSVDVKLQQIVETMSQRGGQIKPHRSELYEKQRRAEIKSISYAYNP